MAVSEAAEQGGDLHLSQRVWGRLVPIPQAGAPRLHHPDCRFGPAGEAKPQVGFETRGCLSAMGNHLCFEHSRVLVASVALKEDTG